MPHHLDKEDVMTAALMPHHLVVISGMTAPMHHRQEENARTALMPHHLVVLNGMTALMHHRQGENARTALMHHHRGTEKTPQLLNILRMVWSRGLS